MQNFLNLFWRCTEMIHTGDDAIVCKTNRNKEKLINSHTFLSGMHLEYEWDKPEVPAFIVCDLWDVSRDKLVPNYFTTGHVREIKQIKNGFVAVTDNNDKGGTTYTFKKVKFNPLREQNILRKHVTEKQKLELQE